MPFGLAKSEKHPKEDGEDTSSADAEDEGEGGDPSSIADSPAAVDQTEESAPYQPMVFRPAFLDAATSGEGAAAPAPAPPPEGDVFFVSVTQDGGAEVHRFDGPTEAQAFVAQLLEKGVPQEEVAAFSGRKLSFTVSHRPIVKLVGGQED